MQTAPPTLAAEVTSETECFHCGLPVDPTAPVSANIQEEPKPFCCIGCKSVCEAIYAAGLQGFYQRTPEEGQLSPPPELPEELSHYDIEEVQSEFTSGAAAQRTIHLLVEGIHCAACVWLIENTLKRFPGVVDARVNLSGRKLLLTWDAEGQQLSAILRRLGEIGYAAVPYDPETAEGGLRRQNRHLLYRMAFAGFAMMNLLWISIALYSGADSGEFRTLFYWAGFLLATPTLIYSGYPFFKGAWSGLKHFHLGMDLPIAIGATITYLYSLYVTLSGSTVGEVYYDTVVNFLFVILVGRYLEAMSKRQAVDSTRRLLDLQPKVATVIRDGEERVVPVRSLTEGDIVRVKPGQKVPADGVVTDGESQVDEAMLTGESLPVSKSVGSRLSAGTINGSGVLEIRVEALLNNTVLGRIIQLVEEAQASKAPIQCATDRVVPWFVAITLGLATATFFWWLSTDFEIALMAATSVLIITCPCAFGLATPMSIAVASGLGARHGILVKNGEVLETLSSIDHFVFDKTGTLTEGEISVCSIHTAGVAWQREEKEVDPQIRELLSLLAPVEQLSEHALAGAILRCCEAIDLPSPVPAKAFASAPGLGVSGEVDGHKVLIGNRAWLEKWGVAPEPALASAERNLDSAGSNFIRAAVDGAEVALIGVDDRLRSDAGNLISRLRKEGMRLTLLSGDRRETAEQIAAQLGGMEVIAEVLPEDKNRVIAELQRSGQQVAMVGDGVNDAPALVRSDVGMALGSGTDVSIASADIVLMSSDLDNVSLAAALSRRTLRTIRQNIGISILYNLIMVPLAMAAFITPLVAAISMPVSSLLVIANAARIRTVFSRQARLKAMRP